MLLILSDQFDIHADVVQSKLEACGVDFFRLNLDKESLQATILTYDGVNWTICSQFGELKLEHVRQVWLRRAFVEVALEDSQSLDPDFQIWRAEWNKTLSGMYLDLASVPWLNPLRETFRAENKYEQMRLARKLGLKLPETLVSNDKNRLKRFAVEHDEVALKLMSQELYVGEDGSVKGIFVNKLAPSDFDQFGECSENPVVLQKYIPKQFEVRYTVVGADHHVCRIDSQLSQRTEVDWRRYDIPRTPHTPIEPPTVVRSKVTELMEHLGLEFGALDFIVTNSDEWYFLEINPVGQWLWIEDLTGLPISDSVANWIIQHVASP